MALGLAELVEEVKASFTGIDPDCLHGDDARAALELVAGIERRAAGLRLLLTKRVADTRAWTQSGQRSMAGYLSEVTGGSFGQAKRDEDTARRLQELPDVRRALQGGRISSEQAGAIAEAAEMHPGAQPDLVRVAEREGLRGARREAERVKAVARSAEQESERRARLHQRRRVVFGTDGDGASLVEAHVPPEYGVEIQDELDRLWKQRFRLARRRGERDPYEAYAADALLAMARNSRAHGLDGRREDCPSSGAGTGGSGGGSVVVHYREALALPDRDTGGDEEEVMCGSGRIKPNVNVIIDVGTLSGTGERHGGEARCEVPGLGPVAVEWIRELLGETTLGLFLRCGDELVSMATTGRSATEKIKIALEVLQPECAVDGCRTRRYLETHHCTSATGWADTQRTRLTELMRLCRHHHQLVTHKGFRLARGPTPTSAVLTPPGADSPVAGSAPDCRQSGADRTFDGSAASGRSEPPGPSAQLQFDSG